MRWGAVRNAYRNESRGSSQPQTWKEERGSGRRKWLIAPNAAEMRVRSDKAQKRQFKMAHAVTVINVSPQRIISIDVYILKVLHLILPKLQGGNIQAPQSTCCPSWKWTSIWMMGKSLFKFLFPPSLCCMDSHFTCICESSYLGNFSLPLISVKTYQCSLSIIYST